MDLDLMKKLCCLNEQQLHRVLVNLVKKKYKKYWYTNEYIMAEGDIPVCLVAHMDTVFPTPPDIDEFVYDPEKTILWTPYGTGFDDRAGIYIVLQLVLAGRRPHLIFTHGEEKGGIGSYAIIERFPKCPFKKCKALIQLDRANANDCVFYFCDNQDFIEYIETFGFVTAFGTFSDISILAPEWEIAATNLSVGYLDEHSYSERLICKWTDNTIEKVDNILESAYTMKYFKYIPKKPIKMRKPTFRTETEEIFNPDICLFCEQPITPYTKGHLFDEGPYSYMVCDNCYDLYYAH